MPEILVLYYSRGGSVARLARQIARGVGEVEGMAARLRTVLDCIAQLRGEPAEAIAAQTSANARRLFGLQA